MNVQTVELNSEKIKFSQFFYQKHFSADHLLRQHPRHRCHPQPKQKHLLKHQKPNQSHQRKLHHHGLINQHQHPQCKCEIHQFRVLTGVWQDQEVLLIRLKVKTKEHMFHFIRIRFLTIHRLIKMEIPEILALVIRLKELTIAGINKVAMCFRLITGKHWIPCPKSLGRFPKLYP